MIGFIKKIEGFNVTVILKDSLKSIDLKLPKNFKNKLELIKKNLGNYPVSILKNDSIYQFSKVKRSMEEIKKYNFLRDLKYRLIKIKIPFSKIFNELYIFNYDNAIKLLNNIKTGESLGLLENYRDLLNIEFKKAGTVKRTLFISNTSKLWKDELIEIKNNLKTEGITINYSSGNTYELIVNYTTEKVLKKTLKKLLINYKTIKWTLQEN